MSDNVGALIEATKNDVYLWPYKRVKELIATIARLDALTKAQAREIRRLKNREPRLVRIYDP